MTSGSESGFVLTKRCGSLQHGNRSKVLFIGENERGCCHLARRLSTRRVTEESVLMELLRGPERTVFYSFPGEDGCLWLEAIPDVPEGPRLSALRPSEFMRFLDDLVSPPQCKEVSHGCSGS